MRVAIPVLLLLALIVPAGCRTAKGENPDEKRQYAKQMHDEVLGKLYEYQPSVKGSVESAAGYATFSNMGVNLFVLATGNGYGVVINNATGKKTHMRMAQAGVGIGLGVKDFRAVFVFENEKVMNQFVNSGWAFGGEADAAAKADDSGGEVGGGITVAPGITLYQLTETGLALQATVSGTKYWKDEDLN